MTSWQKIFAERTPLAPPHIAPVNVPDRPLWSVMIPVYNSGKYLEETLQSVLRQAHSGSRMQIEVVDDCSTDIDVQELVRRVGSGRVGYYRQPCNVGNLLNLETCLNLSIGHYIHLLHANDIVHDGFYETLGALFETYPELGAAFCRYRRIDANGNVVFQHEAEAPVECVLANWLQRLAERQRIQYACIAVKREAYEKLGGFYGVHHGEDWEMWARIATRYSFGYTPRVLASYRQQPKVSDQPDETEKDMHDLICVINKINTYLPTEHRKEVLAKARKFYAYHTVQAAEKQGRESGNYSGVLDRLRLAWHLHKDIRFAFTILKVFVKRFLRK